MLRFSKLQKGQTRQFFSAAVNLFGGRYDVRERILFVLDMKKRKKSPHLCIFAIFCVMVTMIHFGESGGKRWQTALVDDGVETVKTEESDATEDKTFAQKEGNDF